MKDFPRNMFSRRYSAVSAKENENPGQEQNWQGKSLDAKRSMSRGFSIVDSFFNERKVGKRTRWPKCAFLLLAGGLLALTTAVLVKVFQPYDLIFRWKLIFAEGGEIFNLWQEPPVDLYIKIYLFNITNAEDYMAGKDKMRVEEVGPYVYKEILHHDDVVFNENGTISSVPRHPLVWQEELSEGRREDDVVMMLNIALLSIAQVAADKSYFFRLPVNLLIRQTNSQPIVQMTAREFMFGYKTELTTLGNTFMPNWISFDKVGLIDRMYDFKEDYETFYTGENDSSISGLYETYMGSKDLPQWNDHHCSNIEMSSDGTKFKSFLQPNESLLFFRKSMCRAQKLVRVDEETVVSDLAAYKYVFEPNAMDNGHIDERNKCFCRNGYCQPRGLSDVKDCYYGFPISISYPHFWDADPILLENVLGMEPNRTKHETIFMINPVSGLTLRCSVKFQINMHMMDLRSMAHVERFSDTTYPMLWFEIAMHELPKPLRSRFNLYLNILPYIEPIGFWGGLITGILCLILAVIRATLRLPQFLSSSRKAVSNRSKFEKQSQLRSSIYQPCEVKLFELQDKCTTIDSDQQVIICNMDMANEQNFMLEQEPAISDDDDDDGSRSESSGEQYTQLSEESSSSPVRSENKSYEDETNKIYQQIDSSRRNDKENWEIGEASSLIDDIGNDHFPPLIISEDNQSNCEQYTNDASIV